MKKLLYGVVGLIALAVAAIVVVPQFVDAEQIKQRLTAEVEAATGRKLEIAGTLDVSLLPAPGVVATDVRFANAADASVPDMVTLDRLEVRVALLPLLSGEVQVETIRLMAPSIALESYADGGNNWTFAGGAAAASGASAESGGGGGRAVRIDDLRIENGRISYRDVASGVEQTIDGLNATFAADSVDGPFRAAGQAMIRDLPVSFEVRAGRRHESGIPLSLSVALEDAQARLAFEGSASTASAAATVTGKLQASGADLRRLMSLARPAAGASPELPAMLAQSFEVKGRLVANAADVALNDVDLKLGEARGGGALSLAFGPPTRVDATLHLTRFNLDALLARNDAAQPRAASHSAAPASAEPPARIAEAFRLPEALDGSLSLGIDAVTYRGAVVQQVQVSAQLRNGRLELDRASALLPGSSDVIVAGGLIQGPDGPRFEGSIEAASDNLRGLLSWLGIDSAAVPLDRLHKFSVTTNLRLTPAVIQFYGTDLRLDTSRLTGAAAYALRSRPSFSVDVTIDRLNLDAYLPAIASGAETKANASDGVQSRGGRRIALLNNFDTNLKARVESLTFNNTQFDGIAFDGSLIGGVLTLREAAVRDVAGSQATFNGLAKDFAAEPFVQLAVAADTGDIAQLTRAAGSPAPAFLADLGRAGLRGRVEGTAARFGLDVTFAAAQGEARVKGEVSDARRQPHFDFDLDFKHPNLAALAERFGIVLGGVAEATGPVNITGTASGPLDALKLDVTATLLDGTVRAKGDLLNAMTTPTVDLELKVDHPNFASLAGRLGMTVEPSLGADGPVNVAGHVTGNLEALTLDLTATIAGATLRAAGDLAAAMTSPQFDLRVEARHPSHVGLAAPFGLALKPGPKGDGPVSVAGRVTGNMSAVKLDLEVKGAEATARLAGDIAELQANRRMDIRLDVSHPSYQRLAQVLDVARTGLRRDSPLSVNGRLTGNASALKLALDLGVADATVNVAGNVSELETTPRLDLNFSAQHPSFVRLMQSVDAGIDPLAGAHDGAISLSGSVAGPIDNMTAALDAQAAGAQVRSSGRIAENDAGLSYSAGLEAGHGDLVGLMRALGIDYQPARRDLGGFSLRANISGSDTAVDLRDLTGRFGPVDIGGNIRARWDGPRPQLSGQLATNEIVLDDLLPARAKGSGAARGSGTAAAGDKGGERWSSEPIDVTWLDAFDAQLALAARGIVFQGYKFQDPKVALRLSDGVLNIDPLTGRLFDGAVSLRAVVQQKSPLRFALGLTLSDADLRQAMVRTVGINRVSGRFGLSAQAQGIGNSERELVSSLAGNAKIAARDGIVQGIDLRQLSNRLDNINNIVDFAGIVTGAFSGGQTRLISYDSTLEIANGILRSDDGRLILDGGVGTTSGRVNLPRWQLFMRIRMRLPDHPEAPDFGVNYEGPLDAPRRDLRTGALQAFVAERIGTAVLRKGAGTAGGILGGTLGAITGATKDRSGDQTQQQQQQQTTTEPRKRRKSDPAETILKGLGTILGQ